MLKEYEEFVGTTESGSVRDMSHKERLMYFALGLCGEAGEVAEKIKKLVRDRGGYLGDAVDDDKFFADLVKELSDPLWYLTQICREISVQYCNACPEREVHLEELFEINMAKLKDRANRGVIQGSGDNR